MDITIYLDKSVEENAQIYFEQAKKARRKLEGAYRAIEVTKKKLLREEKSHSKSVALTESLVKERSRRKSWFEKFRWFISSDGILIIGGRDASSNELVIKKHMDSWNVVFHTEAPGSPFVVVKNEKDEIIPESTKFEAAIFTATNTRAWDLNIKSVDVFEVMPDQITKEAKSGEFVSKGSFMIYGVRKHYSVSVELAVGYFLKDDFKVIMSGPLSAVSKKCKEFVLLKQGTIKKGDMAKKLMNKFGLVTNDDLLSVLPAGRFDFSKK
ncbi:MAG: NFACT RNA binding domain-containing protein [Candidatus Woesearchaeota archaeon]